MTSSEQSKKKWRMRRMTGKRRERAMAPTQLGLRPTALEIHSTAHHLWLLASLIQTLMFMQLNAMKVSSVILALSA